MLPPGERCRAKVINVPLPGNFGGGSKRNIIIKAKITAKYCYRENIINESHKMLLPGNFFNRKLIGFVRGEYHYTKFIIFSKREKNNTTAKYVVRNI